MAAANDRLERTILPILSILSKALLIVAVSAGGVGPVIDAQAGEPARLPERAIRQLPPGASALPVGMTDYGAKGDQMRSTTTGHPAYPSAKMPIEVLAPLPPSSFERYASRAVDPSGKTRLEAFGYEHFLRAPSTFAPVADVPVGPDYVLGPGDEVVVTIWGRVERRDTGQVGRGGLLTLPVIGAIPVAGSRFGKLRGLLRSHYDRRYVGYDMEASCASPPENATRSRTVMPALRGKTPGFSRAPAERTTSTGLTSLSA